MLITQKYHSTHEIDSEFIPSLERLLCDCVPSFEWIKNYESSAPESTHFHYYLFFSDKHNAPVGFAQVMIEKIKDVPARKKINLFTKIFANVFSKVPSKIQPTKWAIWEVPGCYQESVVVEPRYKDLALEKARTLFEEFGRRDDIKSQYFKFGQLHDEIMERLGSAFSSTQKLNVADTLVKNQLTYQSFLESLPSEVYQKIRTRWKSLHESNISLNEEVSFKELFAYKENGAKLYKEFKKNFKVRQYLNLDTNYYSLEKNNQIMGIVFLIKGHGHHLFYDYILIDDTLSLEVLHQVAIMHFYDHATYERLHLLFNPKDDEYFFKIGFTNRKQIKVVLNK